MVKEGTRKRCQKCKSGIITWVCLGEPEGSFYKCDECDAELNMWKNERSV